MKLTFFIAWFLKKKTLSFCVLFYRFFFYFRLFYFISVAKLGREMQCTVLQVTGRSYGNSVHNKPQGTKETYFSSVLSRVRFVHNVFETEYSSGCPLCFRGLISFDSKIISRFFFLCPLISYFNILIFISSIHWNVESGTMEI